MSLKEQGVDRIGHAISRNVEQARYLEQLILAHPDLETLAPVSLNAVCYRVVRPGWQEEALASLNEEVLLRIQESGSAVPSHTYLHGRFAIRVCITNHRTQLTDLDRLVSDTVRHAHDAAAALGL